MSDETTQGPIRRSETIGKLATALAKAQGEIGNVAKEGRGNFGAYAELSAVTDTIRPALSKEQIATFQAVTSDGRQITITTLLAHGSGEYFEFDTTLTVAKDAVWEQCGGFTYARRYALLAAVGLAPEDDDGQAAQGHDRPAQAALAAENATGRLKIRPDFVLQRPKRPAGGKITAAQAAKLFALAKKVDQDLDELRAYFRGRGWESTKDMPQSAYDDVLQKIEAGTIPIDVEEQIEKDDFSSAKEIGEAAFPGLGGE